MSAPIVMDRFTAPLPTAQNIQPREKEVQSITCEKITRVAGFIIMGIGAIGIVGVPTIAKSVLGDDYMIVALPGALVSLGVVCLGWWIADNACTPNQSTERDFYVV